MIFLTDVDFVYLDYGKKSQKPLKKISPEEIKKLMPHFGEGSMKPKILASVGFLEKGGRKVIITSFKNLNQALNGRAGTIIS